MAGGLAGVGIAVVGGDGRQVMVAQALAKRAAWVRTYGLANVPPDASLFPVASLVEAIEGAGVTVFPIGGVSADGIVGANAGVEIKIGPEFFARLPVSSVVAAGFLPRSLKEAATAHGIKVLEYAERDEIALPNAIPTAEGAIQLAMENTPFTIDGSTCLVLGYGRVARALTKRLAALGARVVVAARNPRQLEEAATAGAPGIALSQLEQEIRKADIVFNTIPAPVLTAGILQKAPPRVLIIDLASAPWGTDFAAAGQRGIKAFPAPGLPGKVAPDTAGKILATHLPGLIEEACARPD
ncbi:MAG TPA: dipicolinate synthase subunit DpsA [Firmicutes bacterium]|jgi:dipicolinate synthase subunit A|nr:dipicolinate synthase subunit DpsA [Bacillota bacterium]